MAGGCYHGVPGGFCAVCNNCVRPKDDSHPVARPDDEPRFKKGRDSAKWVGIGEFLPASDHAGLAAAAAEGNVWRSNAHSSWRAQCEAKAERRTTAPGSAVVTPELLLVLATMRASQFR